MNTVYDRHFNQVSKITRYIDTKFRITVNEIIFLLSFIINLILGRLIHWTAPQEEVYSYFTDKRNILNQLFVKNGWLWTTVVIAIFYISILSHTRQQPRKTKIIRGLLIRYGLITLWWILFTQWCFGLPIMDRIFVFTGGKCVAENVPSHHVGLFLNLGNGKSESKLISSYSCKRIKGGSWEGGHDPSGHVFLLIHSSLYLFLETSQYWPGWMELINPLSEIAHNHEKSMIEKIKSVIILGIKIHPHLLIIVLISFWWFMLLTTNIYFHSIGEKLVGMVYGYIGVVVVYFIPRLFQPHQHQHQHNNKNKSQDKAVTS
ncbi:FIT family protein scs3 [Spathaspora sp. JA1]|nr:FIT family protein scs3 [Spathaspora sp. JA1]